MSWRERMGPASFRGVKFFVETAELSGGRRTVDHEYPLRDEPYSEDMGRAAREYPVEGHVLGADYLDQRDALIAALEEEGPGELVHPYHGTRRVVVANFRERESTTEGGIAYFSITFRETQAGPQYPTAASDATKVAASVATVRSSIGSEFLKKYQPGTLTASAADAIRALTTSMDNAKSFVSMANDEAAAMRQRLDRLASTAASLVVAPEDVLDEMLGLMAEVVDSAASLAAYDFEPGLRPPSTTATREQEQECFDALTSLVRVLAVARAAELVVDETFDSFDAAVSQRQEIADRLDEQLEEVDDDTFAALEQLRADLVEAVPGEASDLPHLVKYTPAATVPSLVLAHRLYGDVDREMDIVARNKVLRPGFVLGGQELEVLSNAS